MISQTKPVHEYFNQLRYRKHKDALATISSEKVQPKGSDLLSSVHRLRSQAQTFHHLQHENQISTSNQKLLQKLLSISKRKKSEYSQPLKCPRMVTFNNPARKKRERIITEMNEKMAERMLTKESQLDHRSMRRSMEEYERIKRTISNNKKALSSSCAPMPLPNITQHTSKSKVPKKKEQLVIKYEECEEDNPQFGKELRESA